LIAKSKARKAKKYGDLVRKSTFKIVDEDIFDKEIGLEGWLSG